MSHVIGNKIRGNHAKKTPRSHSGIQIEVALASIKGERTITELAQQFDVHSNQITRWTMQLQERAGIVFGGGADRELPAIDLKALHAKLGELTLENDF